VNVLYVYHAELVEEPLLFLELVQALARVLSLLLDPAGLIYEVVVQGQVFGLLDLRGVVAVHEVEVFVFLPPEAVLRAQLAGVLLHLEERVLVEFLVEGVRYRSLQLRKVAALPGDVEANQVDDGVVEAVAVGQSRLVERAGDLDFLPTGQKE